MSKRTVNEVNDAQSIEAHQDMNDGDKRFENCFKVPSDIDSAICGTLTTESAKLEVRPHPA